jgi:hypothetical protein
MGRHTPETPDESLGQSLFCVQEYVQNVPSPVPVAVGDSHTVCDGHVSAALHSA